MSLKPFYIHQIEGERGSTGEQLSRGFDTSTSEDEMTSGGQREHRIDVLVENLRTMDLDPEEFEFYVLVSGTAYLLTPGGVLVLNES